MLSTRKLGIIVGNLLRIIPFTLLSTAIPTDMMRFLFVTHAFFAHALCNSPYGLKQTQNMSGSLLLTTEASQLSVGIAEVAYYIENPKTTSKRIIFMELFDILEMLRKLAILCK